MGGTKQLPNQQLTTSAQQNFLEAVLTGQGTAGQAMQQLLGGLGAAPTQELFQQAFVDPAMLTYEQQILPAIQQRFVDAGAGSSSALNQALAQSAADLSTMLGTQMGQFQQQQQQNALNALQIGGQLAGQRTFEPMLQQQQGLLGPLIGIAGTLGGAALGGPMGAAMGSQLGRLF